MGSAERQGDLWGRAPEDWARLQETGHVPLWEAMLDATGVTEGTRVLDAGCGSGGACVRAARRGAEVSGVDAAEPLLALARRRVSDGDFRAGDLEALPFADGSFDAVIAASSIQYAQDRLAAMRELARVAGPEGQVSVGLWSTPDKVDYKVVFTAVRSVLPEPPPGDGPFGLSDPGTLERLAEDAGMTVIEASEADCPFLFSNEEEFWLGVVSGGPQQAALDVVGEAKLKEAVMEAAEPFRRPDGGYRFENSFRYVASVVGG